MVKGHMYMTMVKSFLARKISYGRFDRSKEKVLKSFKLKVK